MDNLDLAIELLQHAKQERQRLDAYNKEVADFLAAGSHSWKDRMEIEQRYNPTPKKAIINDSLRMARRLISREYV